MEIKVGKAFISKNNGKRIAEIAAFSDFYVILKYSDGSERSLLLESFHKSFKEYIEQDDSIHQIEVITYVETDGEVKSVIFNSEWGRDCLRGSNYLIIKREVLTVKNTDRTSILFPGLTVLEGVKEDTKGAYWLPITEENDCDCEMENCDCDFDDDWE